MILPSADEVSVLQQKPAELPSPPHAYAPSSQTPRKTTQAHLDGGHQDFENTLFKIGIAHLYR